MAEIPRFKESEKSSTKDFKHPLYDDKVVQDALDRIDIRCQEIEFELELQRYYHFINQRKRKEDKEKSLLEKIVETFLKK